MSHRFLALFFLFLIISCSSDSESPEEEMPIVKLPTLVTSNVSSITENSVVVGGNVTSDGGGQITERGVVWSLNETPTTSDNKLSKGTGSGEFSITLSSLERSTEYFLRAYAINNAGSAYGNEISFTTNASLVGITTKEIIEITESSAMSGGIIADNGGAEITAKGVCWGTSPNPTIDDNSTEDGSGTEEFESDIVNLEPNTQYYVRSYAENSAGISYGNEVSFTTKVSLKIFDGDVTLKTQQEVDDFGNENYQVITGNLTIGDRFVGTPSDIVSLSALKDLTEIGLKLYIWNNDNLIDFSGLEKLNQVGSDLEINGNDGILDFSGLDNLNSFTGELIIKGNDLLEDMNRFQQVISQVERVFINGNDNLLSMSAFSNITELNGDLRLQLNKSLKDLNDLSALEAINGNLELHNNEGLNDINGLVNLREISGNFILRNNGLSEIIGLNMLEIVTGSFSIENNPSLSEISGFNQLTEANGLNISYNSDNLQVTGFESLRLINGTLRLSGFGINQELEAFKNLNIVTEDVYIKSCSFYSFRFFSNLKEIGGDFGIGDGGSLGNPIGFENLESVGGEFGFYDTSFADLKNFPKLVEVGGGLSLKNNGYLRSVEFVNLKSVGGGVLIEGNLHSLFNLDDVWGLESIGGDLIVKTNNPSISGVGLTNLNAFENLSSVTGSIELTNNPNLEDYCVIRNLLTTFTGSFTVNNNWFNPSQQDIIDGNCRN